MDIGLPAFRQEQLRRTVGGNIGVVVGNRHVHFKAAVIQLSRMAADDRAEGEIAHRHRAEVMFPRADIGRLRDFVRRADLCRSDMDFIGDRLNDDRFNGMRRHRQRDDRFIQCEWAAVFFEQVGAFRLFGAEAEADLCIGCDAVLLKAAEGDPAVSERTGVALHGGIRITAGLDSCHDHMVIRGEEALFLRESGVGCPGEIRHCEERVILLQRTAIELRFTVAARVRQQRVGKDVRFLFRNQLASAVCVADVAVELSRMEEHQVQHVALFDAACDVARVDERHTVVVGFVQCTAQNGAGFIGMSVGERLCEIIDPNLKRVDRRRFDKQDVNRFVPSIFRIADIERCGASFGCCIQPCIRRCKAFGDGRFVFVFHAVHTEDDAGIRREVFVEVNDLRAFAGLFVIRERRHRDGFLRQRHQERVGQRFEARVFPADDLRHTELEGAGTEAVMQVHGHRRAVIEPLVCGIDGAVRRHGKLLGTEGQCILGGGANLRRKPVVKDGLCAFDLHRERQRHQIVFVTVVIEAGLEVNPAIAAAQGNLLADVDDVAQFIADFQLFKFRAADAFDLCLFAVRQQLVAGGIEFVLRFHAVVRLFERDKPVGRAVSVWIDELTLGFFIVERNDAAALCRINLNAVVGIFNHRIR